MCSDTHFSVGADSKGPITTEEENYRHKQCAPAEVTVNWRYCWSLMLPCENPKLRLQLFDKRVDTHDLSKMSVEEREARNKVYVGETRGGGGQSVCSGWRVANNVRRTVYAP